MKHETAATIILVLLLSSPAWAQNDWTGNTLTGALNFGGDTTNYFDPDNSLVPSNASGIQPLATVSNDDDDFVEFSAFDEFSTFGWDVDVDATTVRVEQSTLGAPLGTGDWDIFLSGFDPGLTGLTPISSTFPELIWTVEGGGDTLHLAFPGGSILPPEGWAAEFTLDGQGAGPAGIPAPGALLLGSLGIGLLSRLRKCIRM